MALLARLAPKNNLCRSSLLSPGTAPLVLPTVCLRYNQARGCGRWAAEDRWRRVPRSFAARIRMRLLLNPKSRVRAPDGQDSLQGSRSPLWESSRRCHWNKTEPKPEQRESEGKSAEHVEKKEQEYEYDWLQSPLQNLRNSMSHTAAWLEHRRRAELGQDLHSAETSAKGSQNQSDPSCAARPQEEQDVTKSADERDPIDPITNRRISRSRTRLRTLTPDESPAGTQVNPISGFEIRTSDPTGSKSSSTGEYAKKVPVQGDIPKDPTLTKRRDLAADGGDALRQRGAHWPSDHSPPAGRLEDEAISEAPRQDRSEKESFSDRLWDETLSGGHQPREISSQAKAQEDAAGVASPGIRRRRLTGNYVRDFPEDFERKWSSRSSPAYRTERRQMGGEALDPAFLEYLEFRKKGENQDLFKGTTSGTKEARMQPALDRVGKDGSSVSAGTSPEPVPGSLSATKIVAPEIDADGYSAEPRSLDASFSPDHEQQALLSAVSTVETKEPSSPNDAATAKTEEPVLYKILAYDATMQCINVAETLSSVSESATPLTPAEALLRLSAPAKFFPHFAPLQAQGYEILSGSGDVLIFRKVRDAVEEPAPAPEPLANPPSQPAKAVNPIDMMGSTPTLPNNVIGNFASPTGFVNYHSLFDEEDVKRPPPPFRSEFDARREEKAFSGAEKDGAESSKQSLGQRVLLGAVGVGGISYAVAVIGEYFKGGGMDGLGPMGL